MTIEPVCLDSNYLVALLDQRDVWHQEAARVHVALRERLASTITADCVINEVLTVFGRRSRERGQPDAFSQLTERLLEVVPPEAVTRLYPHVPRWFDRCVAVMRETAGALNFHDAMLGVAADEIGYRAVVSFDSGFDLLGNLKRLDSATGARAWLAEPRAPR
jgi:predicted nucleic acid-binding protein